MHGARLLRGIALSCLLLASSAWGEERFALVIGNSHYEGGNWLPLASPARDAQAIAKALGSVGFQLVGCADAGVCLDATREEMENALLALGRRLQASPGAIVFIYYAGHGVQARRRPDASPENFLVPVQSGLQEEFQASSKAVAVQELLDELAAGGVQAGIIVLDACRDNGLRRSTMAATTRGLTRSEAGGFLIAYSTEPGKVALDSIPGGSVQLSPYARRLAEQLVMSGKSITDVFVDVGAQVSEDTHGEQNPEATIRLTARSARLYLAGGSRPPGSLPPPLAGAGQSVTPPVPARPAAPAAGAACAAATPEAARLAVEAKSLRSSIEYFGCRPELVRDAKVRSLLGGLFHSGTFPANAAYLDAVHSAGIDFIADFPERTGDMTPLDVAVADVTGCSPNVPHWACNTSVTPSDRALRWLLARSKSDALAQLSWITPGVVDGLTTGGAYLGAAWSADISGIAALRRSGLPVDTDEYRAFRTAYLRWLELKIPWQQPAVDRTWSLMEQMGREHATPADPAPASSADPRLVAALAELFSAVAPEDAATRSKAQMRVISEYSDPRMKWLDAQIERYSTALSHPVVGFKFVPETQHVLGHWEAITRSPKALKEHDRVQVDPSDERSQSMVEVGHARQVLATLRASKADLQQRLDRASAP